MASNFSVHQFGDRTICIGGVGKQFYQDGIPISITVSEFKKMGIEVSLFHVADECLNNGWSKETTLSKLKEDFADDIDDNVYDIELLEKFVYSTYEDQREMIFDFLFNGDFFAAKEKIKSCLI